MEQIKQIDREVLISKCEIYGDMAAIVHHRKPIDQGGLRLDKNNMQSVCRKCHVNLHREGA